MLLIWCADVSKMERYTLLKERTVCVNKSCAWNQMLRQISCAVILKTERSVIDVLFSNLRTRYLRCEINAQKIAAADSCSAKQLESNVS